MTSVLAWFERPLWGLKKSDGFKFSIVKKVGELGLVAHSGCEGSNGEGSSKYSITKMSTRMCKLTGFCSTRLFLLYSSKMTAFTCSKAVQCSKAACMCMCAVHIYGLKNNGEKYFQS